MTTNVSTGMTAIMAPAMVAIVMDSETTAIVPPGQRPVHLEDGDAVVFMNFRADRAREITKAIEENRAIYFNGIANLIRLVNAGDHKQALHLMYTDYRPLFRSYIGAVNELVKYESEQVSHIGKATQQNVERTMLVVMAVSGAAVLFALLVGVTMTRSITRPLKEAVEIAAVSEEHAAAHDQDQHAEASDVNEMLDGHMLGVVKRCQHQTQPACDQSPEQAGGQ